MGLGDQFGEGDSGQDEQRAGRGAEAEALAREEKDVIQAKTGSMVSSRAMCVEGRIDCAQL